MIKVGDIVGRKSYNFDIIFEVIEINDDVAILIGKTVRLIADAKLDDLQKLDEDEIRKDEEKESNVISSLASQGPIRKKFLTGKILHLDGDERYLKKCLDLYKKIGVYAVGVQIKESEMPKMVLKYVKFFSPEIIVLTGHDSFNRKEKEDINNYRNSKYFVEALKVVRKEYPVINQPIIIAGACQSHFEVLIANGANFASSPERVNIQSLDPAIIAVKCCSTSINEIINVADAVSRTSNKGNGVGGIESFGTMKKLIY